MSTTVKNPCHRAGRTGFTHCSGCGQQFTSLGISRHWDHCKDPETIARRAAIREETRRLTETPFQRVARGRAERKGNKP